MRLRKYKFVTCIEIYEEERGLMFDVTILDPGIESRNNFLTIKNKLENESLSVYSKIKNTKDQMYKYLEENKEEFLEIVKNYFNGGTMTSNGPYFALN